MARSDTAERAGEIARARAGATALRPDRADNPFSPDMSEADVDRVLGIKPFSTMDPSRFSPTAPLRDIVRNDTRVLLYRDGDIVVRAGDYGNSAFLVISGAVRVVRPPGLPDAMLGRAPERRKGVLESLSQLWRNPRIAEVRDLKSYAQMRGTGARGKGAADTRVFLQDVPTVLDQYGTARVGEGEMFGELAASGRMPRTATVFAEGDTELLEIRWQGLHAIRRRVPNFREHVDKLYRERSLELHLLEMPLFRHLAADEIHKIADETLFESYGDFEWHASFKRVVERSARERLENEPVVVREGDYPDGLLLIRSGFARVSLRVNNGERTVRYLGSGGVFGFEEIAHNWRGEAPVDFQYSLRAVGQLNVLRVPTSIIERYVLPQLPAHLMPPPVKVHGAGFAEQLTEREPGEIETGFLEFVVENRFINGTAAMLIDLDRCVRCDECVIACAATHNGNPRFNRHGKRYDHYMVANACMHCIEPVCMIGCPTGAIHRSTLGGQVVINDATCIGCETCANSCPYDNIRMVDIRDRNGEFVLDEATNAPILKATKCDLCFDQLGGPACQRACPHDALRRVDMGDLPTLAAWLDRP